MAALKEVKLPAKWVGLAFTGYALMLIISIIVYSWSYNHVQAYEGERLLVESQKVSDTYIVESESYKLVQQLNQNYSLGEIKNIVLSKVADHRLQLLALEEVKQSKGNDVEALRLEVTGDLQEFLLLMNKISETYPMVQCRPESMVLQNGQLHMVYMIYSVL
ncbi:hypothetical protein [uncultured Veillonella sp.]|uniref:hypothetical protein n=1 Tax=uncultured Veillonella sp. TaxID=159268 RepID=UPI0025DB1D3E|nr:hypothetical protein [uncultured Veillonella sp.]MDY3974160.1 hypothetical protein [Veillonella caviae]